MSRRTYEFCPDGRYVTEYEMDGTSVWRHEGTYTVKGNVLTVKLPALKINQSEEFTMPNDREIVITIGTDENHIKRMD